MPKPLKFGPLFYALVTWAVLISIVGHRVPILSDIILSMFIFGFPFTLFYILYDFYEH